MPGECGMGKMIPYGRQTISKEDVRAVLDVLKGDWLTQGPKILEFEKALASYCGSKYAVVVSNGTAALHIACLVAGLKKGNEVVTTPITFAATANAVLYTGAKPVFADVEKATANISQDLIAPRITSRTRAILPVDYAGYPCNMEEIHRASKKKGLVVIRDACHALGAEYRTRIRGTKRNVAWLKVGCCKHSDMTVFSFHPVKPITTGEGGAVLTNNKLFYEKLLSLRTHGIVKEKKNLKISGKGAWYSEMQELGFNYRATDIQCALGISQLARLDSFVKKRNMIALEYSKRFSGNPFFDMPVVKEGNRSSWHLYPIRLKSKGSCERDKIFKLLRASFLGVQVHYLPVYMHPYYQRLGYRKGLCPNAEAFHESEISLPIYPSMVKSDISRVVDVVSKVFKKRRKNCDGN